LYILWQIKRPTLAWRCTFGYIYYTWKRLLSLLEILLPLLEPLPCVLKEETPDCCICFLSIWIWVKTAVLKSIRSIIRKVVIITITLKYNSKLFCIITLRY
jgi:hypothetical protein